MTISTRELNKMTKEQLIYHIQSHEVHKAPSFLNGMTMGLCCFFEKIVQYLLNIKASQGNAWLSAGCKLYDVTVRENNDVVVTFKAGAHSISTADYLKFQERSSALQAAIDMDKSMRVQACDGCPGPGDVDCQAAPKYRCLDR